MVYEVTTSDGATDVVDADAYGQEGALTTFFQTHDGRPVITCWSIRLSSYRTSEILRIRRVTQYEGLSR